MRAAIMDAPGEVLVSVAATGICAGDMYIYRGTNPYARYPVIGGHEIAGTVAEAIVIEATGNIKAMEQTVDLVAAGGRIVIVGLVRQGAGVTFPGLDFTRKEMTIVGSRASVDCFPEALELLANGKISYPRLATEFDMWDAPQVFADLNQHPGAVHKGILVRNG
jgi:threonine dehydrogenase-like Zn-dependent dehydrogenase